MSGPVMELAAERSGDEGFAAPAGLKNEKAATPVAAQEPYHCPRGIWYGLLEPDEAAYWPQHGMLIDASHPCFVMHNLAAAHMLRSPERYVLGPWENPVDATLRRCSGSARPFRRSWTNAKGLCSALDFWAYQQQSQFNSEPRSER